MKNPARFAAPTILACALLPACAAKLGTAGRSDVSAAYSMGTLTTELGPEVSVITIASAAERSLRARGYAVTAAEHTEDRARIVASRAGAGTLDKTVVESWVSSGGTIVAVHVDPFGDEPASYAILDDLLARIGR